MTTPSIISHKGARILVIDYSQARGSTLRNRVDECTSFITSQPPKSLLILTRVTGLEFSPESTKILLEHISGNEPYTIASAVVGLGHLTKAVPIANRLTGRDLNAFEDEAEALAWLAAHAPPPLESDEKVGWVEFDGEKLLRVDFRECGPDELPDRIRKAAALLRSEKPKSVVALNLVNNFPLNRETGEAIKHYVRDNRPYVVAAAVVGLGYMKPILPVLNRLTGRNIRSFDDVETAERWLIDEKRRIREGR